MFHCCVPLSRDCVLKRGSRESMSCTGHWFRTEPRPLWPFSRLDPESPQAADQCDSNLEPGADVKQPGWMTRSPRRQSQLATIPRSPMQGRTCRGVHLQRPCPLPHRCSCSSGAGGLGGLS
uniref:Uncharacterized protein n=1 Tax=Molossus molossus TaxID=27622 RepID=A0A7J8EFH4_MOLMO|nr:hypothetical protein HJG59_008885 [Molossus molossus]